MSTGPVSFTQSLLALNDVEKKRQIERAITEGRINDVCEFINFKHPHATHHNDLALRVSIEKNCIDLAIAIISKNNISKEEKLTEFNLALNEGRLDVARALLSSGIGMTDRDRGLYLQIAASKDYTEVVRAILSSGAISEEDRGLSLTIAAQKGGLEIVRFLLAHGNHISDENRNLAVEAAVDADHLEIVRALINDFSQINPVEIATREGHKDKVKSLISLGVTYSKVYRGNVVLAAARSGHFNIVQALLLDGVTFSEANRGNVIIPAAKAGHLEIVKALRANRANTSEDYRDLAFAEHDLRIAERDRRQANHDSYAFNHESDLTKAVKAAAGAGHLAIVQELLSDGATISEYDRGQAVIAAATAGHLAIVQALRANRAVRTTEYDLDLAERDLGQAVIAAAGAGHLQIVQFLLTNFERFRGEAVQVAAREGHLAIVQALLANGATISEYDRGQAVIAAAGAGHLQIVEALLTNFERFRGSALIAAAREGHLAIVQALLANGATIPEWARGDAVEAAARKGHLQIVEALLANGTISENNRGQAVIAAGGSGHLQIVQALLANGATISEYARGQAVIAAAREGHSAIVQTLLANGATISEANRGNAVQDAARKGHLAIVQALLANGATISEWARGEAVLAASSSGNRDILEFILQRAAIRESVRNSAITQARGPHAGQIRDMLRLAATTPDVVAPAGAAAVHHHPTDDALVTNFQEVKSDPAHFLEITADSFPRRVVLTDNAGAVDLGGVTKQFISTLVEALCEKEVIARNDQLIPGIRDDRIDKDTLNLQRMGQFYSQVFERNKDRTDKFVIGNLFHPRFFDLVKIALSSAEKEEKLKSVACLIAELDTAFLLAKEAFINPTEPNKAAYRTFMGIDDEEANPKEQFQGFLAAAEAFASGLTGDFRAEVLTKNSISLMRLMQGEAISPEKLIAAIRLNGDARDLIQKKDWIVEKISENDVEWMKKFIFSITGTTTLPSTLRIQISPSWRNAFEIHTCFNSLDVPTRKMSKEAFLPALEAAITGQNYNTA